MLCFRNSKWFQTLLWLFLCHFAVFLADIDTIDTSDDLVPVISESTCLCRLADKTKIAFAAPLQISFYDRQAAFVLSVEEFDMPAKRSERTNSPSFARPPPA